MGRPRGRHDGFTAVKRYCIMCAGEIPTDRRGDAVTCGYDCKRKRENYIRSRLDQKECRYCRHPSTPQEREEFSMWREWHKKENAPRKPAEASAKIFEGKTPRKPPQRAVPPSKRASGASGSKMKPPGRKHAKRSDSTQDSGERGTSEGRGIHPADEGVNDSQGIHGM